MFTKLDYTVCSVVIDTSTLMCSFDLLKKPINEHSRAAQTFIMTAYTKICGEYEIQKNLIKTFDFKASEKM